MRHDVHLDGEAFRLRPVSEDDASFIVALRGARGHFLNRGATTEADQREWLSSYFARPGDYFFVIEAKAGDEARGLVALYDVDTDRASAEWGRWVVQPGSAAAVESALLVYRFAFDRLQLARVFCRTIADNAAVVHFHDSCGLERIGEVELLQDGVARRAIRHALDRAQWPAVAERLGALARRFAARRQVAGQSQ